MKKLTLLFCIFLTLFLGTLAAAAAITAPTLSSATGGLAKATLQWTAVVGAKSYKVYYGTKSGVYDKSLSAGNKTLYTLAGLKSGTKYFIAVTAVTAKSESAKSNVKTVLTLPAIPKITSAVGGVNVVALKWSAVPGATGYKIYYRVSPKGVYGQAITVGKVTAFTVKQLGSLTAYSLSVSALNATGEGKKSVAKTAKTLFGIPAAPSLTAAATAGVSSVALKWSAVTSAAAYKIYYGTSPGIYGAPLNAGQATQFTVTGLSSAKTYYFVVTALDSKGESPRSNEASALTGTLPVPKVTLTADPLTINPGQSVTLSWQSTNALTCTIDPDIGDVALSGSMSVSPAETTTYRITASGPGGTDIQEVTITVEELKPTANISANPASIASNGSTTLSWTSANAVSAFIDNGVGEVSDSGSVAVAPKVTTTYTLTVTGPLGSASSQTVVTVTGAPEVPAAGTFGAAYSDIIPTDATVAKYDPKRFAVIRGIVKDKNDSPLDQVSVVVDDHASYGTARTDAKGEFSLPVEGGGTLNLILTKPGYITIHRQVQVSNNDVAVSENVTMLTEDSKSTEVTLDGNPDTVVVHESSPVTDASGTRQASVVFTGDNKAYAVADNGQDIFELSKINVRATEFSTPESMPAKLPPTSAFTYCMELKVDGVKNVRFKDPVVTWVDNFLGFNVGEIVPVGYYDRERGVWVASENGRVVKLLDTDGDGIVDALDSNGDGKPDDLNGDGDFSDEVKGLDDPETYQPGKTFWRVSLSHFTPWDCNWPVVPPGDATAPNASGAANVDQQKKNGEDCDARTDSFVNCRSRVYHEDIDIPGTGLTLHYASNRVADYKTVIRVPASGATVPTSLKNIRVRLEIAGRTFEQTLNPLPNQNAEFGWDGLDYLGKPVASAPANITTEFVYQGFYSNFGRGDMVAAFGSAGNFVSTVVARQEFIFSTKQMILVRNQAQKWPILADGWTLSNHHYVSPTDVSTLYKGDGTLIQNDPQIITTVAGTGVYGYSGDGGTATAARLSYPYGSAVDSDGNIFIIDSNNNRIRKIDASSGIITTVAGPGNNSGYMGDGLATESSLYDPSGVAFDNAGNMYIADTFHYRICKVDTRGVLTTFAGQILINYYGGGFFGGYSGDGGLATAARLNLPKDVAVDNNGNIYIADASNCRIRKVDTYGIITTVAGTGFCGNSGDGGLATATKLSEPSGVAVDKNGNIYIADIYNQRILKVDASSGIITKVAGRWTGYSGDGGLATAADLHCPSKIAIDNNGSVYISDTCNDRIRKVDTNGIITTIAGTGVAGYSGDGGPAIAAQLNSPSGVAVDNNGNVYIADTDNSRIRKISSGAFVPADPGDIQFAEDGVGYVFSSTGQHKQTIDLDTKKVLEQFVYDTDGRLISVTDRFGNRVTIERNASGVPTGIVSPDGIRTTLTIDANNQLTRVTYPDTKFYKFEYSTGGLLTKETEPKGNVFTHTFDAHGRITDVLDEEGEHQQFGQQVQSNGDVTTTVTTAEGNVTTYLDHTITTGTTNSTISVTGIPTPTLYAHSDSALTSKATFPDLTVQNLQSAIDPEYKFEYLTQTITTTPAGRKAQVDYTRTYTDTNSDGIKDCLIRTVSLNSKTATVTKNTLLSQITTVSPLGRTVTTTYDPETLLTSRVSVSGLTDTTYSYDPRGQLTAVNTGSRGIVWTYDTAGNVQSVRDPKGNTTTYDYDALGRTTAVNRPDSTHIRYEYDANGNMTVLTVPSTAKHTFTYNKANLNDSYKAPVSLIARYVFDKDRRLKQKILPSGKTIQNIYTGVLLTQVQTPEGNVDLTYKPSGQLAGLTKSGEAISYTYDGSLRTAETLTGTLGQALTFAYNNDFNVTGFTYAGTTSTFGYDNDGLLTSSGGFTIGRNAQNGLATSVTGGPLNLTRTFNSFGEVSNQAVTVNSVAAGAWSLTYNDNGQIATKSETVAGATSNYSYTYDTVGRLTQVQKNGTLVEEYRYNDVTSPGARTYEMNSLRGIGGRALSYNAEDQLLTAGASTYQYDADGFLKTKTDAGAVTTYTYSTRGELLSVALPDGRIIEYVHDPLGRRIAKKINGTVVEKYLWSGLTQLLAVYDGSNNLVERFEYADSRVPVSMTKSGQTYYLAYDQVGSLRAVTNASGTIVKRIDYDTFGNILTDTAPAFTVPLGFAGGLQDRDTGLVRFGFRDYDPATGRWTAKDPIGFDGGDADLYGYVFSDPVNFVDAGGLQACPGGQDSASDIASLVGSTLDAISTLLIIADLFDPLAPGPTGEGILPAMVIQNSKKEMAEKVVYEMHHSLPRQFKGFFRKAGLDIEKYVKGVPRNLHRIKPDGLHTGSNNWNSVWKEFIRKNPDAGRNEIRDQLKNMMRDFGIGGKL